MVVDDKVVLITGGTGSLGQKFTQVLLENHKPAAIRIFSRDELKQLHMRERFANEPKLRFLIGDVRDRSRLTRAMQGVDVVVHAAALKQVEAAEYNPLEAVQTNILGAANVIEAAIDCAVEKVVAVSTDKAVYPVNLYGATKLVSEKLFVHGNSYVGSGRTRFSCVRYGNVVGSRGSVVPLFLRLKESGEFPITDERMTRFWITLEQAVDLVLLCIREMKGGEIFVPKIPSMRITDLAEAIDSAAKRRVTGIRPGEKIHEYLLTQEEASNTRDFGSYYVVEPRHSFWNGNGHGNSRAVASGFQYSSDQNERWLTSREVREFLKELAA